MRSDYTTVRRATAYEHLEALARHVKVVGIVVNELGPYDVPQLTITTPTRNVAILAGTFHYWWSGDEDNVAPRPGPAGRLNDPAAAGANIVDLLRQLDAR